MKKVNKTELLKLKKEYLIAATVVGVVLMLIAGNSSLKSIENESTGAFSSGSVSDLYDTNDTNQDDYASYASKQIKSCLQKMEGVGDVEVFLNISTVSDSYMGNDSFKVDGIMIVAEGADNPLVVKDITEACEALFSLEAHKIKIVRMKEEN